MSLRAGGCQNYGPFMGALNIRCRIMLRTQSRTIIWITTHMGSSLNWLRALRGLGLGSRVQSLGIQGRYRGLNKYQNDSAEHICSIIYRQTQWHSPARSYIDDINPALPEGPKTIGTMVYMFPILGNAGFISSTVCAEWELLGILWWDFQVVKPSGNFICSRV